ncbi:MAG: hypothetical protein ACK4TA_05870 [Saprospiraceae bacterium]
MRNNRKVINHVGVGKDLREQLFVAVTTNGSYQKGQIYRVLMGGVNAAMNQYSKELKDLNGQVKFLLPSQQIVFNQHEVERSLWRLQNNWLVKFRAQLLGIRLQLSYEDQEDFEMKYAEKQKPLYVPKQAAYEHV